MDKKSEMMNDIEKKKITITKALLLIVFPSLIFNYTMAQGFEEQGLQPARFAKYNAWANEQMNTWLSQASDSQMHKQIESSFNTLYKTAIHLWNAEVGWMQTVKNEGWKSALHPDTIIESKEMLNGWLSTSESFANLVTSLSESELKSLRTVGKKEVPIEDILLHVFNHATYHRGQLITMGRQAGLVDPPRLDYIYYITR